MVKILRHLYLCYIIKNPFYKYGGAFQRITYSNIVSIDLTNELEALLDDGSNIYLFFGESDTATPPSLLLRAVPKATSHAYIIKGGGHDIANTHTSELVELITQALAELS